MLASLFRPISAAWGFAKNHKKAVALGVIGSAAIGGIYIYRKVKPILDEVMNQIKAMEQLDAQMSPHKGLTKKQMLQHRFEHQLGVGDMTLRNFALLTRADINTVFNVDQLRDRLREKSGGDKREPGDLQAWEDLKVWSFARALTTLYALCLQNLMTKLHLSLAARYVLVEESVSADPMQKRLCDHINRQYFSVLSQHTHTKGLKRLCDHIGDVVAQVLSKWKLSGMCSFAALQETIAEMRRLFEVEVQAKTNTGISSQHKPMPFLQYVLPDEKELDAATVDLKAFDDANPQPQAVAAAPSIGAAGAPAPQLQPQNMSASLAAAREQFATIRFAEMIAETRAVCHTQSFQTALKASFDAAFDVLSKHTRMVFAKNRAEPVAAPAAEPIQPLFPTAQSVTLAAVPGGDGGAAASAAALEEVKFANVAIRVSKLFGVLLPDKARELDDSPLFDLFARRLPAVSEFCSVVYLPLDGGQTTAAAGADTPAAAAAAAAAGAGAGAAGMPPGLGALAGLLGGPGGAGDGAGGGAGALVGAFDQKSLGGFGGGPQSSSAAQMQFMNSFFGQMAAAPAPAGQPGLSVAPLGGAGGAGLPNPFGLPVAAPVKPLAPR